MLRAGITAALMLMAAAGPAVAQQFDLRCQGTRQWGLDADPTPHSFSISVDLDAGRWCWNDCERTYGVADVGPDRITFVDEEERGLRKESRTEVYVERTTGAFRQIWIEVRPFPTYLEVQATCDPAPFSGFPAARF